ncbi:MAG: hypothetical protein ACNA71_09165, partial [Kiritimatiellia bacterium]
CGILFDLQADERIGVIQAERRIGAHTRIGLDGLLFTGVRSSSRLASIRQDDFVRLQLTRYF